jgi:UDP-N-acetylmuramate--alanine ligase
VWQPHTYSRTKMLFDEFVRSFSDADQVIVTEIYRSREAKQDFSASEIVRAMNRETAHFAATLESAREYLVEHLEANDVVLVLSAGDANQISTEVLDALRK